MNSLPLSVRMVRMQIGQARSRSRRKRRAFAAVLALKTRMNIVGIARAAAHAEHAVLVERRGDADLAADFIARQRVSDEGVIGGRC